MRGVGLPLIPGVSLLTAMATKPVSGRKRAQTKAQRRKASREGMRALRARRRAEADRQAEAELPPFPDDPAGALEEWSRSALKVPPGHPQAGEPMTLPPFGVACRFR